MTPLEFDAWIERESEAFASVLDTGDLDARVPGCPDWSRRDLAVHLGTVQRFWTTRVRAGADIEPDFAGAPSGPPAAPDLAAWMRESTAGLLDALRSTDPDTPAWVWWRDNRTVGAIARHQVQEAAVHRWDAQSATGAPDPIALPVADDGVDEFIGIARQLRGPAPIALIATDSGHSFPAADEPSVVSVSGAASDLVLLLYGRIPADAVAIEGDRAVLEAFLLPVG